MEMTDWRYWLKTARTLDTETVRKWRENLHAKLHDKQFAQEPDAALWRAMDDAIDYALFERSGRWVAPWDASEPHTAQCLECYARQLDETIAASKVEAAWLAQYGATYCRACYAAGMFYDYGDRDTPPSSEVCDTCLGNERVWQPFDAEGQPLGTPEYIADPICPRCGQHSIVGADPDDIEFAPKCTACGWQAGDGYPDSGGAYPECTCPTR